MPGKLFSTLILKTLSLSSAVALASGCGQQVRGFLMPTGGGPIWELDSAGKVVFLETRTAQHHIAIEKLKSQHSLGATAGHKVCGIAVENSDGKAEEYLFTLKKAFAEAGLTDAEWAGFQILTRGNPSVLTDSTNPETATRIRTECGLIYLPGGDQTAMKELIEHTPVHEAFLSVLQQGGGIMGNSAGAAIEGSLVFFPGHKDITTTRGLLSLNTRNASADDRVVLQSGIFTTALKDFPTIYVETHTDGRERTARALALMAAYEQDKEPEAAHVTGLALDSDTAALISWDDTIKGWTAEVHGGRSLEYLAPTKETKATWKKGNYPFYSHARSELLFKGARIALSGPRQGEILARSTIGVYTEGHTLPDCSGHLPSQTFGDTPRDMPQAGQVYFMGTDPNTGAEIFPDEFEYAEGRKELDLYLTGHLIAREGRGCGYWASHAYNPYRGHRKDRLPMSRYALGKGLADFAIALPSEMLAEYVSTTSKMDQDSKLVFKAIAERTAPTDHALRSSLLVYDVRNATRKGISDVSYPVYKAVGPVQTGTWENGRAHLLAPGSSYTPSTGEVEP